jgi:hypothetical protein
VSIQHIALDLLFFSTIGSKCDTVCCPWKTSWNMTVTRLTLSTLFPGTIYNIFSVKATCSRPPCAALLFLRYSLHSPLCCRCFDAAKSTGNDGRCVMHVRECL